MSDVDKAVENFGNALSDAVLNVTETDSFKKAKRTFLESLWDDVQHSIIDRMPEQIEWFVRDMAEKTVKEMLEGRDDQMRRHLGLDGYTGRDRKHEVIHGTLFEAGALALRKKIAQAHADLIQNERINDLEAQVSSLVNQVNERDQAIDRLSDKLRDFS